MKSNDRLSCKDDHGLMWRLRSFFYRFVSLQHGNKSFALEGEDVMLHMIFRGQKTGFYVDVGAHHPYRLSNTLLFYLLGWRGINIDGNPESMRLFDKFRPRDQNIVAVISDTEEDKMFDIFEAEALSHLEGTKSKEAMDEIFSLGNKIKERRMVRTQKLSSVLHDHLPRGVEIDFLSIDVEGAEMGVLRSMDWELHKPKFVLIEDPGRCGLEGIRESKVFDFMVGKQYELVGKTYYNLIFKYSLFKDGIFYA